ncbi:hypothetical protein [Lysobacter firmicutimachus]|uniref:Microcin J25-processing protein McjB C-terminal domain-containing protein n=1 Tax=Lysobacter firmicutimachus TaxID=1792846 RepID=A0ABU8D8Z7_9GAMM
MSAILKPVMHWKLPHWIRRILLPGAAGVDARLGYEAKLMAAHARTALAGLQPPPFTAESVRYAPATAQQVHRHISRTLGHLSEDLVVRQRFGLVLLMRGLLERELRVPLTYTLGYVYQCGQRLYHTPIVGLEQMLLTGIAPGARISLHAWLTLPSHEVVDLTFWAAFPAFASEQERIHRGLFMHPSQMAARSYHPQWVGDGFVRRIGILKEYEGW